MSTQITHIKDTEQVLMQLYAFDSDGQLVNARHALKHTNYFCLECHQILRMRGGPQRRSHFYHIEPTPFCRQHQKGPIHLQLQSYFLQQLPAGDCRLELPFPSIQRIADVAWISQKMIFEIQYSPISSEEILARNRDYQQLGWTVVWILHDHRYNQIRLSAAEIALRSSPHFFSNMDSSGSGIIYDQFDICEKGMRLKRLPPLPIHIKEQPRNTFPKAHSFPLVILNHRAESWKLSLIGDLLSLFLDDPSSDYLQQAREMENQFYSALKPFKWSRLPIYLWQRGISSPYQIFFRFLLERMCR